MTSTRPRPVASERRFLTTSSRVGTGGSTRNVGVPPRATAPLRTRDSACVAGVPLPFRTTDSICLVAAGFKEKNNEPKCDSIFLTRPVQPSSPHAHSERKSRRQITLTLKRRALSCDARLRKNLPRLSLGVLLIAVLAIAGCRPNDAEKGPPEKGALFRVGSIVVTEADLDHALAEKHASRADEATRKKLLDELVTRAQFAQAALDAGLDRDPAFRAEMAAVLASRLREQTLNPRVKEIAAAPVPEPRLRELYKANGARFRSNEKRQVAVLWLNPNGDPDRTKQNEEKLASAREWLLKNPDLKDRPEQGFSVLSVDYSEHAASRYKGGVVGWLEREGGMDPWSKAVAAIAFSLNEPGEVSNVTSRPEGIFLVRYMAMKPAVLRPFEDVSAELTRAERQQKRAAAEAEFDAAIKAKHPVQWLDR